MYIVNNVGTYMHNDNYSDTIVVQQAASFTSSMAVSYSARQVNGPIYSV